MPMTRRYPDCYKCGAVLSLCVDCRKTDQGVFPSNFTIKKESNMQSIIEPTTEEVEATGGAKQLDGKLPLELIPGLPIFEVARVLQFGAQKYDDWNWYKGLPIMTCIGSAMRHIFKFTMGEDHDDESGLPHLAHAMCNVMFALQFCQEGRGDNRPHFKGNQLAMVSKPDEKKWAKYANVMGLDK